MRLPCRCQRPCLSALWTAKNRLCDFKKDHRWSSSIYLGYEQVAITWQLQRATQQTAGAPKFNRAL